MPFTSSTEPRAAGQWISRTPLLGRMATLPGAVAWAVLVLGLLLTAAVTLQYASVQRRAQIQHYEDTVDGMTVTITNRLRNYNTVLNAAAGMFEGSEEVTPSEFATFIGRLELETLYAGLQTVGYVKRVEPYQLDALAQQMRQYPLDGYHNFRYVLAEEQFEHLIITHIEAQEGMNHWEAIGVDLAGFPERRDAMMLAVDRGVATATRPLQLLPVLDEPDSLGIVVYVPVFEGDQVDGFVFTAFRTEALMSMILAFYPQMWFEVYDGAEARSDLLLLYRSDEPEQPQGQVLTTSRRIAIAGRPWTIVYHGSTARDPWLIALPLSGLGISVLLATFVWHLSRTRAALAERAEQLQQHREWLQVTLASIGDAVVATDPEGRVTYMNDHAEQLTGWRTDEIRFRDAHEVMPLVHEHTGEEVPSPVSSAMNGQSDTPLAALLVCRSGERVPVEYIGSPIRSTDGKHRLIGAVVTLHDVRERRESELALRETNARLEFVLESAEVGEWDMDLENGTARRSLRHDQIFGYDQPLDHWGFERFLEHVHPDDRAFVVERFEKSLAQGDEWHIECRVIRADGAVRWIEAHGSIYQRRKGRPTRMLGLVEDITYRKSIEEDLRRSEERFRNLVTATSSIIWTADGDGIIVNEVESWQEFTGQTPEQYLGEGWLDAVHPDDREDVEETWRECNRRATPVHIRYRMWHRSGAYRRVEGRGVPILNPDGRIREWVGSITDIEEQERVAEALLIAEQKFRWIIESAVDFAIFTFDVEGRINSWNSGAERLLGYEEDEILGRNVRVIFTEEDREEGRPAQERREALADYSSMDERWHVRADGSRFYGVGRVTPLQDDHGNVLGFVKILHDRTNEQLAQEALERRTQELQESESRFRTMADTAPAYIWMADVSKACTWFNKPWLEFTGRKLEQEIDSGWESGIHPDDKESFLRTYNENFDARRPFTTKYRLRRADGNYRWLLDHGVPLHAPDGTFAGYIGSCIDITDLEDARETLERYSSDLERLVDERTSELRESAEQLRLSERMASLGTLAAGIGHDLGNLLLPMRIRLDLIEEHLPSRGRESLQVIRTTAEYLGNLAKGLRYLSTDPARVNGAGGRTNLHVWWNEAQPMLKNALPKNVSLQQEFPEDLPDLAVTPAALMQAIFNLVQNSGNALRDREGGGCVRLWADAGPTGRPGHRQFVRVGVTDDGPGMDPEVKRRCMEPFFSTRTREFSTGLGLSLVQGVVQRAEGHMEIQSKLGQGTTIILSFPAVQDSPTTADGVGRERTAAVRVSDARVRAFVTAELKTLGFEPTSEDQPADLLVLDGETMLEQIGTQLRGNPAELKKTFQDIVEEDQARTIVLLRQPDEWANQIRDINGRLIRTSSAFKPSEIREALRKAAKQSAARQAGPNHGDIRHQSPMR